MPGAEKGFWCLQLIEECVVNYAFGRTVVEVGRMSQAWEDTSDNYHRGVGIEVRRGNEDGLIPIESQTYRENYNPSFVYVWMQTKIEIKRKSKTGVTSQKGNCCPSRDR